MDLMFLEKAFVASGTGSGLMFLNLVGRYAAAGRAVHGERQRLNAYFRAARSEAEQSSKIIFNPRSR